MTKLIVPIACAIMGFILGCVFTTRNQVVRYSDTGISTNILGMESVYSGGFGGNYFGDLGYKHK